MSVMMMLAGFCSTASDNFLAQFLGRLLAGLPEFERCLQRGHPSAATQQPVEPHQHQHRQAHIPLKATTSMLRVAFACTQAGSATMRTSHRRLASSKLWV